MSFFHVLPSNVAPDSFPRNHASAFSTPVANSYHLEGKWEVALLNITYSGCINTFHQDQMVVEKSSFKLKDYLSISKKAIRIKVSGNSTLELANSINDKFEGVLKLSFHNGNRLCIWKVIMSEVIVIIPKSLKALFGLHHDVITSWDDKVKNNLTMQQNETGEEFYITVFPPSYIYKSTVLLKQENEKIERGEVKKRFSDKLGHILQLQEHNSRFLMKKLHDDNILVVFPPVMHQMINFSQAGFFTKGENHQFDPKNTFKTAWKVNLYHVKDVQDVQDVPDFASQMNIPITLDSLSFKTQKAAIAYLNKKVDDSDIVFTLLKDNVVQLKITKEKTTVSFSDSLRDILAFDQNSYTGKGTFSGSASFSLTRRIQYLYVYSSVSDYIRIGDTEAPLLAVIPFNHEVCSDLLQEKTFKIPMYVPVIQTSISQIDIAIYDGAGALVPFTINAVSSLRLHFRQL